MQSTRLIAFTLLGFAIGLVTAARGVRYGDASQYEYVWAGFMFPAATFTCMGLLMLWRDRGQVAKESGVGEWLLIGATLVSAVVGGVTAIAAFEAVGGGLLGLVLGVIAVLGSARLRNAE